MIMKTFEEFNFSKDVIKRAFNLIDLDKKNKNFGEIRITEDDPYGEELWETENREEVVKNNLYKVLTNRIGDFGQKPIYDVFLKTENNNYLLIGDIRYHPGGGRTRTPEEIEKEIENIDKQPIPSSVSRNHRISEDDWNRYKESLKRSIRENPKTLKFIVYFYNDEYKYRTATNKEVNKIEKMTEDEINYMSEYELSHTVYSGHLMTDISTEVTYFDKLYYMIKEK